jgi:hypothetical protein
MRKDVLVGFGNVEYISKKWWTLDKAEERGIQVKQ